MEFEEIKKRGGVDLINNSMNNLKLKSFSINNFKVFGSKTVFDMQPITLLTGTNNSGKSSFIKALLLLKNSFIKTGLCQLDIMDTNLKLGGIETIFNFKSRSEKIEFDLAFTSSFYNFRLMLCYSGTTLTSFSLYDKDEKLNFSATLDHAAGLTKLIKSYIRIGSKVIDNNELKNTFHYLSNEDLKILKASAISYLEKDFHLNTSITITSTKSDKREKFQFWKYLDEVIMNLENIGQVAFDNEETGDIFYHCNPMIKDIIPETLQKKIKADDKEVCISQFIIYDNFKNSLPVFHKDKLSAFFEGIDFIGAVRGKQEIIFTRENTPKDTFDVIEECAKEGGLPYDILEYWLVDKLKLIQLTNGQQFKDIFKIKPIPGLGYMLVFTVAGKEVDITSFGYGVMQLIPVLLKLALYGGRSILIIEEPESNLHPAFQSKLADIFCEAKELYSNSLIIETHSEYLIRKLQYLTASNKSKLTPADTVIYYFYPPNEIPPGEPQVKKINILNDGYLSDDFGSGFFDEASKIAISLFGLQNSQKN